MKKVAIPLLLALVLNGCSSNNTVNTQTAQTASGGIWSAEVLGGSGEASGFSFITQFTVNSNGSLNITYFQFLTAQSGANACFPVNGGTQTGTMNLSINGSTNAVTGTFTYSVAASGNTLALAGQVTGTASSTTTLTGGSITGTWKITGGTGCDNPGSTFTMTQTS